MVWSKCHLRSPIYIEYEKIKSPQKNGYDDYTRSLKCFRLAAIRIRIFRYPVFLDTYGMFRLLIKKSTTVKKLTAGRSNRLNPNLSKCKVRLNRTISRTHVHGPVRHACVGLAHLLSSLNPLKA